MDRRIQDRYEDIGWIGGYRLDRWISDGYEDIGFIGWIGG